MFHLIAPWLCPFNMSCQIIYQLVEYVSDFDWKRFVAYRNNGVSFQNIGSHAG